MSLDERVDQVNEGLTLIQKKEGLVYGTDAYLLYAYIKAKKTAVALELGAGTGIISLLALQRNKFASIYAVEVQPAFAEVIERNATLNRLSQRLKVIGKDLREVTVDDIGREVDCVFANPPYMKTDSGYANRSDAKYIARHEVMGDINDFCLAASRLLKYGGRFYAVYRPDRMSDLLTAMRGSGLEPKRLTTVHADSEHAPSLLLVEARKGGSVGLFVTKPLLLATGDGISTADIDYIYKNGAFHEQFDRP